MLECVDLGSAQLQLSIELGSDPISGSVAPVAGEARRFSGWIELVAAIEDARASSTGQTKTLGGVPGAKPKHS
jgi:hypothetical protein